MEFSLPFHIKCPPGSVGRYCLLPGDPGRCELIASHFERPVKVAQNREFVTYTGELDGARVSVTSTGIGGPSAAITMEELFSIGADTFIRIGTCGGIDQGVEAGDVVIASGAVRHEGTSREYAPIEFPAVAHYAALSALVDAARARGKRWHAGVVQCKDSFYGQHSPDRMPTARALHDKWEAWRRLGVLASEMESAALFTVAAALRVRCGAVFHVIWNQERAAALGDTRQLEDTHAAVELGVDALRLLIARDREADGRP